MIPTFTLTNLRSWGRKPPNRRGWKGGQDHDEESQDYLNSWSRLFQLRVKTISTGEVKTLSTPGQDHGEEWVLGYEIWPPNSTLRKLVDDIQSSAKLQFYPRADFLINRGLLSEVRVN
ncbi:MAG: hypothetical protein J7J65_04080 [Candidatus Korarchaeota archaeon]|nr:hypothetical protein [Candidatus Korarchaeota archaeon]